MSEPARTDRFPKLAKYELIEELGHGGMATVYRARDRRLGREVAVKVIHPHLRDSREVVSRFNAEAKAVAMLRHPNIVDVYDVSAPDEPEQYLVVGLVRGTTLRRLLEERGVIPCELAGALALELLAALAHAHARGVIHRDVKPENVLLEIKPSADADSPDDAPPSAGGPRVTVKLTDFGIAKLLDAQGVTSTGQVLGSPAHMAPEQIEGGEVGPQTDVFGVGVLLYGCMVGHLPFEGSNPAQVLRRVLDGEYPEAQNERPAVGSRWSKILDRALARSAADRYPDATTMRDAVAAELDRLALTAREDDGREFDAWLEDASRYDAAHDPKLIERLCALAGDARKRGDVLAAAADYNRALAYAPNDPHLLKIVSGMQRAEARSREFRRAAIITAVAVVGAGVVAAGWGARRAFVEREHDRSSAAADERTHASVVLSSPTPDSAGPTLASAPLPAESLTVAFPMPGHKPSREPARTPDRHLTLDLRPPMGVSVSIDGQQSHGVSTGDVLTLGSKPHALAFSCPVCTSVQVTVDAGDRDGTLVVSVPVKPATLFVDGDARKTYQLVEHPEIAVRAGANTIALRSAYEPVTIKQIESGDTVSVRLEAATTMRATFP